MNVCTRSMLHPFECPSATIIAGKIVLRCCNLLYGSVYLLEGDRLDALNLISVTSSRNAFDILRSRSSSRFEILLTISEVLRTDGSPKDFSFGWSAVMQRKLPDVATEDLINLLITYNDSGSRLV